MLYFLFFFYYNVFNIILIILHLKNKASKKGIFMRTTAIICEYNPFTYGHMRHLESARKETDADTIICVMSGSFTQRGEAAILDRYQRAELATRLGADMVVELPLIYAISPADNFAYGALKTVSVLPNVEYLSFGSECGDIDILTKTADFVDNEPEEFKKILSDKIAEGNNYPKAYSSSIDIYAEKYSDFSQLKGIFNYPNNCLGICYIRAAKKLGLNIKFHTIKRENNDNSNELSGEFPSAAAIRYALRHERFEEIQKYVHPYCYNYLKNIKSDGLALNDLCLFKMKSISGYDLEKYYDIDVAGGLHNRLKLAAAESVTFNEFLEKAKTKKYTMARIKRICLYALFDITNEMYDNAVKCPPHVYVLSANKLRKDILSELYKSCENVLIRYSDMSKVDKSLRFLIKLDFQAHGTLNLINRSQNFNKSVIFV